MQVSCPLVIDSQTKAFYFFFFESKASWFEKKAFRPPQRTCQSTRQTRIGWLAKPQEPGRSKLMHKWEEINNDDDDEEKNKIMHAWQISVPSPISFVSSFLADHLAFHSFICLIFIFIYFYLFKLELCNLPLQLRRVCAEILTAEFEDEAKVLEEKVCGHFGARGQSKCLEGLWCLWKQALRSLGAQLRN